MVWSMYSGPTPSNHYFRRKLQNQDYSQIQDENIHHFVLRRRIMKLQCPKALPGAFVPELILSKYSIHTAT